MATYPVINKETGEQKDVILSVHEWTPVVRGQSRLAKEGRGSKHRTWLWRDLEKFMTIEEASSWMERCSTSCI